MSRIIGVTPHKDYTITILFDDGSRLLFNMQRQIETVRFKALQQKERFCQVDFTDKSIFWREETNSETIPMRLTLDNILFTLRDSK